MRPFTIINKNESVVQIAGGEDGGAFHVYLGATSRGEPYPARVIASNGGGWDHVSVSYKSRTPTWDEMCRAREIFFDDEDCALQYHPPKSVYKNVHDHCLHLWRPQTGMVPMPPLEMV